LTLILFPLRLDWGEELKVRCRIQISQPSTLNCFLPLPNFLRKLAVSRNQSERNADLRIGPASVSGKKQNDQKTILTKIISRSFGYGLHRKPLIFQARQTTYRARAPSGAALGVRKDRTRWKFCIVTPTA
jgi:hypothetical protein